MDSEYIQTILREGSRLVETYHIKLAANVNPVGVSSNVIHETESRYL
jgi:hypothetical protein